MRSVIRLVLNICRDRKAATAVEYGFILAFIVVALIAAIVQLGATTTSLWTNVSTKVQATN
jgi:pilus assembly protein Flp/PilA